MRLPVLEYSRNRLSGTSASGLASSLSAAADDRAEGGIGGELFPCGPIADGPGESGGLRRQPARRFRGCGRGQWSPPRARRPGRPAKWRATQFARKVAAHFSAQFQHNDCGPRRISSWQGYSRAARQRLGMRWVRGEGTHRFHKPEGFHWSNRVLCARKRQRAGALQNAGAHMGDPQARAAPCGIPPPHSRARPSSKMKKPSLVAGRTSNKLRRTCRNTPTLMPP